MIVSLAVALLLGVISASKHSVSAVADDFPDVLKLGDYFSLSAGYSFDLSYSLEYAGGPYSATYSDAPADGFNFEEYSINVQSLVDVHVTRELFSFDKQTYSFVLTPFRVSPLVFQVIWFRPEDTTGPFNMNFWFARRAELLTLHTEVEENEKVTLQSVIDYSDGTTDHIFPESSADWTYGDASEYTDDRLSFDIGSKILSPNNMLLGEHTYFNYWILDNTWSSW